MKYSGIIYNDVVSGPGFFLTFFTSGCPHHCPGCHNPETWDENYGYEFTDETIREIVDSIHKNGIERGLAIQGGEPLYHQPGGAFRAHRPLPGAAHQKGPADRPRLYGRCDRAFAAPCRGE